MRGLANVQVNGVNYPFYFGINTLIEFCELEGVEFDGLSAAIASLSTNNIKSLRNLMFAAHKAGVRRSGCDKPIIDIPAMGDLIDDMGIENVVTVITTLTKSMETNVVLPDGGEKKN